MSGLLFLLLLSACVTTTTGGAFSTEVDTDKAVESHLHAASQYLRARDTSNAMRHLQDALALDPKNAATHGAMAYSFELTKDIDLAEQHYKKAIVTKDGKGSAAVNNYGVFLFKQGRYSDARKQLQRVTGDVLYRNRAASFALLGLCEGRLGDKKAAKAAYERSLTLDRTNAMALIELADMAVQANNISLAKRYYETYRIVARASPRSLLVGMAIAKVSGDQRLHDENRTLLEKLFPGSVEYSQILKQKNHD